MAAEKFEFRIPMAKLLVGLLVTIIPMCLVALYSISQSERSLERTIGGHFKTIAESTAFEISQFIHDRAQDVGWMTVDADVVAAVTAANRAYAGLGEAAFAEKVKKVEESWNTTAAEPLVKNILASPASRYLRRLRAIDQRFLRVTVTDEKGAVIAGTHKTLDYFQADEDFWQAIYAQGRGALNITDILYDEVTKSNYIGIGAPVLEEGTNRFIGAVDALVDLSSVFPIVNRPQIGPTARALLVKDDGTLIAGPGVTLAMNLKSDEYAAIHDATGSVAGRQTGYVVAGLRSGGRHLIGFADTGLKQDYKNVAWLVVVSQDTREALAGVRMIQRLIAFMALIGLAAVTLLAVYFALHRREPMPSQELHDVAHPSKTAGTTR